MIRLKKSLAILSIFTIAFKVNANELKVNSKLTQANVFLSGAQLLHTAQVNLPAGMSELHLEGISPSIKAQTLQAGGKGDFIILEVGHFIYYPEPKEKNASNALNPKTQQDMRLLEDSIIYTQFELDMLSDRKNVLIAEKRIMDNNKLYKGEGKSDSLSLFTAALEFYRRKMNEINAELLKIRKDEQKITQKKDQQQQRLSDLRNFNTQNQQEKPSSPVHKVRMLVMADAPVNAFLNINYYVDDAGWTHQYDVRAVNTDSPVKFNYKAMLFQKTSLDWNNVKLMLSSANPRKSNHKPQLQPQFLSYQQHNKIRTSDYQKNGNAPEAKLESNHSTDEMRMDKDALHAEQFTELIENISNYQYEIKLPYRIASDGKLHAISIMQKEINSVYENVVVPKLDAEVFITARISGWDDLNLLPGNANIYFENMYVGETFINAGGTADTLVVVLGRDQNIQVSRKKIKSQEKERLINNEKVLSYQYEISLKNGKNNHIRLLVEDQFPVSNDQQIKVELIDNGKAEIDANSGFMRWDLKLKPKESKLLKYTYVIRHDRSKDLSYLP